MSTVPGDSSWADAGLVPPDSSQVQDPSRTTTPVEAENRPRAPRPELRDEAAPADADEYEPDPARPDRSDQAAEHDVLEGYEPTERPPLRDDAPEPDVAEQAQEVPEDDREDYPSE